MGWAADLSGFYGDVHGGDLFLEVSQELRAPELSRGEQVCIHVKELDRPSALHKVQFHRVPSDL